MYANSVEKPIQILETNTNVIWNKNDEPERLWGKFYVLRIGSDEYFDNLQGAIKKAEKICDKFSLKWKYKTEKRVISEDEISETVNRKYKKVPVRKDDGTY